MHICEQLQETWAEYFDPMPSVQNAKKNVPRCSL